MNPKHYTSSAALRRALEDRLQKMARDERLDLQRLRRQVAFDRLLCRLFHAPDSIFLLKPTAGLGTPIPPYQAHRARNRVPRKIHQ
jgi:hypothetical protein